MRCGKTACLQRAAASAMLVLLLMTAGSFRVVWAHEADKEHNAEELLELMQIRTQVDLMLQEMRKTYQSQLKQMKVSEQYQTAVDAYQVEVFDLLTSALDWASQEQMYVDAYQSALDDETLDDIVHFLRTKSGQRFIASQLEVQSVIKVHVDERIKAIQPQLQALNKSLVEDMKAAAQGE